MNKFIGRNLELRKLNDLFKKSAASLVICKGRRRIGKSRLIQEFGKSADQFIQIQGLAPAPGVQAERQLANFSEQLSTQTNLPTLTLQNWTEAFSLLANQVQSKKTVLLLDEISWMADGSPDFPGKLKITWDTLFKTNPKLVIVLCGSVSSWLESNILKNADFVGRITLTLNLTPLNLSDCNYFWGKNRNRISSSEKFKVLAVTGGIPRYLEEIDPTQTAEQNIKKLCFDESGMLFSEFENIFDSIFLRRAPTYKKIVKALAEKKLGMQEICKAIKVQPSGTITKYLEDLESSGFVRQEVIWKFRGKSTRNSKYTLKDNYLRFYLKYVLPQKTRIKHGLFTLKALENLPNWETISGFQFENLVLNNLEEITKELNISPDSIINAAPFIQTKTSKQDGCQIDLLYELKQETLYLCEIKFRKKIQKEVIDEVKEKIKRLKRPKHYSMRPVLIYAGELDEAITNEGFFDSCINMGTIL